MMYHVRFMYHVEFCVPLKIFEGSAKDLVHILIPYCSLLCPLSSKTTPRSFEHVITKLWPKMVENIMVEQGVQSGAGGAVAP